MMSRLQQQGIADDGADRGKGQRAGHHVLRAMQQNAHREATLRFDRNRIGATAAARPVVIRCNLSRHVSSPDGFDLWIDPGREIATPE
jgi:hypothetical protein